MYCTSVYHAVLLVMWLGPQTVKAVERECTCCQPEALAFVGWNPSVYHCLLTVLYCNVLHACAGCLLQVAKAVEDILYAATQEEGEAHLAAAIAELELRDDAEQEQVRTNHT